MNRYQKLIGTGTIYLLISVLKFITINNAYGDVFENAYAPVTQNVPASIRREAANELRRSPSVPIQFAFQSKVFTLYSTHGKIYLRDDNNPMMAPILYKTFENQNHIAKINK